MKLSKKLITLLGASTLGFSALVPVVGANAATSGKVVGNDPTTGESTTELPASTTGGINDTKGTAAAQSNAHVAIQGGYLTLIKVPDFNFGTVRRGATNNALVDNSNPDGIASDGNSAGTLQVSDYRDDGKGGAALGYSVTADIGTFTNHSDDTTAMNGTAVMHLKATNGTTLTDPAATPATITSVAADLNTGVDVPVLNLATGTGYGVTTVNFNQVAAASLDVPGTATNGSYNAPITWTLHAAAPTN